MKSRPARNLLTAVSLAVALAAIADEHDDKRLPLEGGTTTLSFDTSEGSWMSLDVTPDGEAIVFDLLGDLYTLPIGGGRATRITSGLGFDSQPRVSPDGRWIAFVSDRNGADNLWIARIDGSDAKRVSDEKHWGIISPAWLPDSRYVVATRTAKKTEFTLYHIDGGKGVPLSQSGAKEEEDRFWGVGAVPSPDGRYLYFAQGVESNGPVEDFPATQITRFDRETGDLDQLTRAEGGAVRPLLSPDGSLLVYGTRHETKTGLRVRNLVDGSDRWLVYPVQRDGQENFRPPSRDLLPGYAFTPDSESVVFNADGGFHRVDVDTGNREPIEFSAHIELDVGPDLTAPYRVAQGPLQATLIQDPQLSPDGSRIVASVLTRLYLMDAAGGEPQPLTGDDVWAFKPAWSPDGRWIAYVTWSMEEGGHVWRVRSSRRGSPQRLTDVAAFYTDLVYGPGGETLYVLRGNEYMRHQMFSEFSELGIPLELVSLPADGGRQEVIVPARGARNPHFGGDPDRIYLYGEKGLHSIRLDGSDKRDELIVTGPRGNRRDDEPPPAEMVKLRPDGRYALALINKQVWALAATRTGGAPVTLDAEKPALPMARLTDIGADFFGWTADGESVWWAIGSSFLRRPFDSIEWPRREDDKDEDKTDAPFAPGDEHDAVSRVDMKITVPRNTPSGSMLLRGASVITMSGDTTDEMARVLTNQDVLITDNRIAAIGTSGSVDAPGGAEIVDVDGKFIVPGFIDTHAHWEFRTGDVLEPHNWSLVANLAYGVTAGLDVQTSHKDYLAYRDFVETGQSMGQRAFMTAEGIFGNSDFDSYDAAKSFLRRYSDHYKTHNIKSYVVGNRRHRQWIVKASKELGLMPTTEGAADQKLDLTHAIDGMHGNEHTLPDSPLFNDVVQLFARTKTAYTPTLIVQYNAERSREYFFAREEIHDDPKLQRFYPHNRLDELTRRRPVWQRDDEFHFRQAAADAAKIQRAGGLVGVGGHAELQGLGYHWEMWAYEMGGMTAAEVLRAATIDGARIIGIDQDLGSVEAGKLADLVILDANPLEDIRNTTMIFRVVQNGRLYDDDTLDQLWPDPAPLPQFWWWDDLERAE